MGFLHCWREAEEKGNNAILYMDTHSVGQTKMDAPQRLRRLSRPLRSDSGAGKGFAFQLCGGAHTAWPSTKDFVCIYSTSHRNAL